MEDKFKNMFALVAYSVQFDRYDFVISNDDNRFYSLALDRDHLNPCAGGKFTREAAIELRDFLNELLNDKREE